MVTYIYKYVHIFKYYILTYIYLYTIVKINSKYKEDDFSDSNAVAFSLNVYVLKIHFLHGAHMSNPASSPPPLLQIPAPAVSEEHWR